MYIISIYEDRSLLYQELSYDEPSFGGDAESSPPSNTNFQDFLLVLDLSFWGFALLTGRDCQNWG